MKNPDVVAFWREGRRCRWLFCEVKRDSETVHELQWKGLAFVHALTGADVAVVRLVPERRLAPDRMHPVTFKFEGPWRARG